jgi:hypothetical protein
MKYRIGTLFFLGLTFVLMSSAPAYAQEQYRTEIFATYQRSDFDLDGRSLDALAGLEFFLAPVNTAAHPYAEAAFLEKIGSVGFAVMDHDFKGGPANADGQSYDLFVNYTTPDFPVVIRVEWTRINEEFQASSTQIKGESDFYRIVLGKYLSYGLLADIGYVEDHSTSRFTTPATTNSNSNTSREYSLHAKYVRELTGGTAVNLEASAVRQTFDVSGESRNSEAFSLGGDYYFNRGLSVGATVVSNNSPFNSADGKTYSVNARFFITPSLSLKAGYERFLNDNNGELNTRNYAVTLAARF